MVVSALIAIAIVAITLFYIHIRRKMSYWRNQNIAEDPGFFPFGSQGIWDTFMQRKTFIEMADDAYKKFEGERLVGSYDFLGRKTIVLRDPDLIKQVLVKDFDCFSERQQEGVGIGGPKSKNNRYFRKTLTELRGKEWKKTRSSLTPIFTSGKLKAMVPLIHKVADNCNAHLQGLVGQEINAKELMKTSALDVIVSTGFGYETNSFIDTENPFKRNADLMVGNKIDLRTLFIFFVYLCAPKLLIWLDIPYLNKEATLFFSNVILEEMKQRKEKGTRRNDLIDLVNEAFAKENENFIKAGTPSEVVSEEEIEDTVIANSLLLFIAGFDTVSSTSALMLYFLAKNQDVQQKLFEEITTTMDSHVGDELDYAAVMGMSYLDKVFLETQRYYPISHLERACGRDYKVPGMDLIIPKETIVRIPVPAIVKDKLYYDNPQEFNPENYNEENKAKRHPYTTGGFGHGPRNCIAMRFAILEVKIAVTRILTQFKILPCAKTVDELIPDPSSASVLPKGGLWISFEKRNTDA